MIQKYTSVPARPPVTERLLFGPTDTQVDRAVTDRTREMNGRLRAWDEEWKQAGNR